MSLTKIIRETAKENDISIAQAEELWEFPFKHLRAKYSEIDLKKEIPDLDFLWKKFITIKVNKIKANKYKNRLNKDVL